MALGLDQYQTFVFDCDGVILNSNKVKTQAFYEVALNYGQDKAQALVEYHVQNGGVSRYLKFEYFIKEILRQPNTQVLQNGLLDNFAAKVKVGLMKSDIAQGLLELRELTAHAKWLVVSGGDQDELREIFKERDLLDLFDGGIFGSPDNKDIILHRELDSQNILMPSLFLGDSKYDYQASDAAGLDFVFLTGWTEVKDWKEWAEAKKIKTFNNINELRNDR